MILIILLITILVLLFYTKESFTELESSPEFKTQSSPESSSDFIQETKPYKNYTISDGENEYVLISYSLLHFNLKRNIIDAIKNKILNIDENIFDLESQEELINLKSNISQQNDYIFAINKLLLLDEQKINNNSKIIFDENNNPKYLNFSETTKNVINTMKIDSDSKYAQLFLDDNRNLTITNEKNPINKDLNLKLTTIENNKIMNNYISLELIDGTDIYKIKLSREPTNFILKEEIINI